MKKIKQKDLTLSFYDKNSKLFNLTLIIFFGAVFALIFLQISGLVASDVSLHNNGVINNERTYSLYAVILSGFNAVFGKNGVYVGSFLELFLSFIFSLQLTFGFLKRKLQNVYNDNTLKWITLSAFLVSMVYISYPFTGKMYYGYAFGNVWHNSTLTLSRTFAIPAFFLSESVYEKIHSKEKYTKELLLFSLSLFLSTFAKPSFFTTFIIAAFIVFFIDLCKSKFKLFKDYFLFGLSAVPSLFVIYIQNNLLFSGNSDNEIAFGLSPVFFRFLPCNSVLLSLILSVPFPLFVAVTTLKRHSTLYKISILTFLVGLFEVMFIYEDGPRMYDGNMGWGYLISTFFFFLMSIITFFGEKYNKKSIKNIGLILLILQVLCGIGYLVRYFITGLYK